MSKITIIGSGRVGSTIAYSLTCRGLGSEIVIIDINGDRAMGEAQDIRQGLSYDSSCIVYAGNYEDAKDSDIVVITSGIARKPVSPVSTLSKPTSKFRSPLFRK